MANGFLTIHRGSEAEAWSHGSTCGVHFSTDVARIGIKDRHGEVAEVTARSDERGPVDGTIFCHSRKQAEALAAALNMPAPTAEASSAEEAAA
ncbi:MAG: hypothetical protein AAF526_02055 [Pseudomonadota bacterium]